MFKISSSALTTGTSLEIETKVCDFCGIIQFVNPLATILTPQLCRVCNQNLWKKNILKVKLICHE